MNEILLWQKHLDTTLSESIVEHKMSWCIVCIAYMMHDLLWFVSVQHFCLAGSDNTSAFELLLSIQEPLLWLCCVFPSIVSLSITCMYSLKTEVVVSRGAMAWVFHGFFKQALGCRLPQVVQFNSNCLKLVLQMKTRIRVHKNKAVGAVWHL